eukprot:2326772-Amphidinium_carterae.1
MFVAHNAGALSLMLERLPVDVGSTQVNNFHKQQHPCTASNGFQVPNTALSMRNSSNGQTLWTKTLPRPFVPRPQA